MLKKIIKHPWIICGICLIITAFFTWQLRNVKIENTVRLYMPTKSNSYQTLLQTEEEFGSMIGLGIALETPGKTILKPEYISIIDEITEKAETVDYVENVKSLSNIDYLYGKDGGLASGTLVETDDETGSYDTKTLMSKIVEWQEMYNRVIIDETFKTTQILISIAAKDENGNEISSANLINTLHKIQKITEEAAESSDLTIRYFGDPVLSDSSYKYMVHDLVVLIPIVALVVLLSLYFSFHSFAGTILPLITVLISTIWSCGIMAVLDIKFTIIASVIPICLIACGSAYGIHVITHYYAALEHISGEITKEKHLQAIIEGLKDVMLAVILAAITTIAGFISNITSPIHPLRSFSIFSAAGVAFSLILSIILIPALLYTTPITKVGKKKLSKNALSERVKTKLKRQLMRNNGMTSEEGTGYTLYAIYHFFAGSKARLAVSTVVMGVFAIVGIKKLIADTSLINYFPPESKIRTDIKYVDENLAGTNSLYFVVSGDETEITSEEEETLIAQDMDFDFSAEDTGDFDFGDMENYGQPKVQRKSMTNPEILTAVDEMHSYLMNNYSASIGKIVSFTTFIKRMNQIMNAPSKDANDISEKQISIQEGMKILQDAYSYAGGKSASIEEIVTELQKLINFNGSNYYEIPADPTKYNTASTEDLSDLVTQYLYLLSSDQITKFANDMTSPTAIRTQVQLKSHSTAETKKIIDSALAYSKRYFPKGYTLTATGNGEMEYTMTSMVMKSQMISIAISIGLVFMIISISFKSPIAGLTGAIPLALTIALNFMVMGFTGIKLDLVTSIIASLAIGVGVDYTIHFMQTYRQNRIKSENLEAITKETFKISGKGIITNAMAVGLGFLVLLFSKFIILRYIGILVAIVMFISSSLALFAIPGILNIFDPKFMSKKSLKAENADMEKQI